MTTWSTSLADRIGFGTQGPNPGFISTSIFIACVITKMSEKSMAASGFTIRIGCTVISAANSGVLQRVKKSYFSFIAINSGKYLPACLIIHTGGLSTDSPFTAYKKRSYLIIIVYF